MLRLDKKFVERIGKLSHMNDLLFRVGFNRYIEHGDVISSRFYNRLYDDSKVQVDNVLRPVKNYIQGGMP